MLFSRMEQEQLTLPEEAGVVLSDPEDAFYEIAVEYSRTSGRALRHWRSGTLPPKLAASGGSIVIVMSLPHLTHPMIMSLSRNLSINGYRKRNFGIVTGETAEAVQRYLDKLQISDKKLEPGWVLGDAQILSNIYCETQQHPANLMQLETVLEVIEKQSEYGLIVGHGREDVCYFPSFAICGQRKTSDFQPCVPHNCPYPQSKIHPDQINAQVVVWLSCSAGKIGKGLFPFGCRLALSSLAGSAVACIAPEGLFTLKPGLVEYVLNNLNQGYSVGDIATLACNWHYQATGEFAPFLVFGDPDIHVGGERLAPDHDPKLRWNLADESEMSALAQVRDGLKRMVAGIEMLEQLDLLPDSGIHLKNTIGSDQSIILRLINLAPTHSKARQQLLATWSHCRSIMSDVTEHLVDNVSKQVDSGYFWLASHYSSYLVRSRMNEPCALCGSDATEEVFEHPFRPSWSRVRVTCSRCGIVEDRPVDGVSIRIASIRYSACSNSLDMRMQVNNFNKGAHGMLFVGINNGRGALETARLLSSNQTAKPVLPDTVDLANPLHIELLLNPVPQGVYFVKVFWVEHLQITVASAPAEVFA